MVAQRVAAAAARRVAPFAGGWFLYLGYELAGEIEPSARARRVAPRRAPSRGACAAPSSATGVTGAIVVACRARVVRGALRQAAPERDLRRASPDAAASATCSTGDVVEERAGGLPATASSRCSRRSARRRLPGQPVARLARARWREARRPPDLYRRLRRANPAPFAGIAALPGIHAAQFVARAAAARSADGMASTRPIAGTRPRGRDRGRRRHAEARPRAEREGARRARHAGRPGAQRPRPHLPRRHGAGRRVHDRRDLRDGAPHRLERARRTARRRDARARRSPRCFPGGTITGCPKVRCMQLLAGLEAAPRDAYTGSMGYLGLDGSLDLNILIRTLTVSRRPQIEFRTGAGIVADSGRRPNSAETRAKAQGTAARAGETRMIGRRLVNGVGDRGHRGRRPGAAVRRRPVRDHGRDGRARAALSTCTWRGSRRAAAVSGFRCRRSGLIDDECERVLEGLGTATVKLTITRGPGPARLPPARRAVGHAHRRVVGARARAATRSRRSCVRICDTRLGLNPLLAGMKHLNRLEQVMACAEWDDPAIGEGLMLSTDGRLVSRHGGQRVPGRGRAPADAR